MKVDRNILSIYDMADDRPNYRDMVAIDILAADTLTDSKFIFAFISKHR